MTTKNHDPQCRSLAEYFLAAERPGPLRESEAIELAQAIQDAVEAWFDFRDGADAEALDHRGGDK